MKTLILCRHAKSDWPDGVADIQRPLKQRGIHDATFLGNLLAEQVLIPDQIISSPANRAISTARIVAQCVGYAGEIQEESSIYYEGVGNLMRVVQELPESLNTVMIFGHNPTMENAVRFLLQANTTFDMPTCGMACFESYQSWKFFVERSQLRWLLVPRLKRKSG